MASPQLLLHTTARVVFLTDKLDHLTPSYSKCTMVLHCPWSNSLTTCRGLFGPVGPGPASFPSLLSCTCPSCLSRTSMLCFVPKLIKHVSALGSLLRLLLTPETLSCPPASYGSYQRVSHLSKNSHHRDLSPPHAQGFTSNPLQSPGFQLSRWDSSWISPPGPLT